MKRNYKHQTKAHKTGISDQHIEYTLKLKRNGKAHGKYIFQTGERKISNYALPSTSKNAEKRSNRSTP